MIVHCEITIVLRIIIACRDIVVSMNLHGRVCEVGTRRDMRTLKPGSWLFDTVSVGCAHMNLRFSVPLNSETFLINLPCVLHTMFQPINLVVVQLTNRQRDLHNDGRHTDWFFPVYLSVSKCLKLRCVLCMTYFDKCFRQ